MEGRTDAAARDDKVVLVDHSSGGLDDFVFVIGDDFDSLAKELP